jgi:hypothetical protein
MVTWKCSLLKTDSKALLWDMMSAYIASDENTIQRRVSDHIEYTLARDR